MKKLFKEGNIGYLFDYNKEPVLSVKEGEDFIIETEDAINGVIKSEKDILTMEIYKPYSNYEPVKSNPITGPIYIEGAEKGDIIKVNIKKIIPNEIGIITIIPGNGPLSESKKWPELGGPCTKILKHIPGPSGNTSDGQCIYNDKIKWNLDPFIGTIGICPDYEIFSSLQGQFPSGGNWDCRDIKEGSKLYLNCYHDGGLLFLGDVHGCQGDTEWSSSANEVSAEVILSCQILKNKKIPYARIEKDNSIIQLYSDKPLELAVKNAIINLMDWIISEYGIKPMDAYMIISTNPEFRVNIYQMVDWTGFKYTVGAEFPKKYLIF